MAVTQVQPGASLADTVKAAKAGDTILLAEGATYPVNQTVEFKTNGVRLIGCAGSVVQKACDLNDAKAWSTNTFRVYADNITVQGVAINSNKPIAKFGPAKVGYRGVTITGKNATVANCSFLDVDDAVFFEPTAVGAIVANNIFDGSLRACGVWMDGTRHRVMSNLFGGSQNEHCLRIDAPGTSCSNIEIVDNVMANRDGKECLTIRRAAGNFLVANNSFSTGWVNIGYGTTGTAVNVSDVRFVGNTLSNGSWLEVRTGAMRTLAAANTFNLTINTSPVHVTGPQTTLRLIDNTRVIPGVTLDHRVPFARLQEGLAASDVVELGTVEA